MAPLGRYEILSKLAEGGMAEVFVARLHGASGFTKRFAIKQLLPALEADPELVQMFLDEARIASSLSHPNICQIFELGVSAGRHFIAMEYLQGQTVAQVARRARREQRPLPYAASASIIARAADGLAYAHDKRGDDGVPLGIVHRDVSPDNVMLTEDGQVKLLDFGIARATHRSRRTKTGLVRGKVAYMAPEQIRGEIVDGRADVFSLGVILWELLAAKELFGNQSDVQAMYAVLNSAPTRPAGTRVPAALWEIAESALEKDVSKRLPSAGEMARRLDAVVAQLEVPRGTADVRAVLEGWSESPTIAPGATPMPAKPAAPAPSDAQAATAALTTAQPQRPAAVERPRTRAVEVSEPERMKRAPLIGAAFVVLVALSVVGWKLSRPEEQPAPAVEAPKPAEPPVATAPSVPAPPESAEPLPALMEPKPPPKKTAHAGHATAHPTRVKPDPAEPEHAITGSGKLALDTHPWTKIYLDGRLLGDTPLDEVTVPAGHLKLHAVNTEAKLDKIIEVDVMPNQVARVRREW